MFTDSETLNDRPYCNARREILDTLVKSGNTEAIRENDIRDGKRFDHNYMLNDDHNYMVNDSYLTLCFIGTEDVQDRGRVIEGPEAIYTGTVEAPRIQLARTDLPGGPIGDEMWVRLTTGLQRRTIAW